MNNKTINIVEELNKANFINVDNLKDENFSILFNSFCETYSEKKVVKDQFQKESKRLFIELSEILNKSLKVSYDITYWRILIGSWFFVCAETLYNRIYSISSFVQSNFDYTFIFNNLKKNEFEIKSNLHFHDKIGSADWNQLVIFKIIQDLNLNYSVVKKESHLNNDKKNNKLDLPFFRKKIKYLVSKYLFLLNTFNNKLIFNTSLNRLDEIKLQLRIMKLPLLHLPDFFENIEMKFKYNYDLRSNLINQYIKKNDNEKIKILKKILLEIIPIIYLENFHFLSNKITKSKLFKIIATSQHFDFNEYYKFLASKNYLNNCKIIYFQHGNVDGVDKFDIYNNHMMSSSKYLTWGWDHPFQDQLNLKKSKNIQKFYNIKSSGKKRFNINSNFEHELVFFSCSIYKGIYFWDVQKKNQNLFNNQLRFFEGLDKKIITNSKIKYHPDEKSYNEILKSKVSDISMQIKNEYGFKKISNYNNLLSVYSYDSTGFYEHIALNKPTIVYLDNFNENVVDEAIPYYSKLKDVKIIHDNPKSAAEFINSEWNNIKEWWYSEKTQHNLKTFSEKFSRYTDNPYKKILDELNK